MGGSVSANQGGDRQVNVLVSPRRVMVTFLCDDDEAILCWISNLKANESHVTRVVNTM